MNILCIILIDFDMWVLYWGILRNKSYIHEGSLVYPTQSETGDQIITAWIDKATLFEILFCSIESLLLKMSQHHSRFNLDALINKYFSLL